MTSEEKTEAHRHDIKNFNVLLAKLEGGATLADLTDEYHRLIEAMEELRCNEMRKVSGAITLKLDFSIDESGIVNIMPAITAKHPKARRGGSVMWVSKNCLLTPRNPQQTEMDFREVEADEREIRNT